MELVANVWPVVDADTGMVHRYFMRAYAFAGNDQQISVLLNALAATDFCMARVFYLAKNHQMQVGGLHPLHGTVPFSTFQALMESMIEPALVELENDLSAFHGLNMAGGACVPIQMTPKFGQTPYVLMTPLLEQADGSLTPQLNR